MNKTQKKHPMGLKATLWGILIVLALLLIWGNAGRPAQGSMAGEGAAASPQEYVPHSSAARSQPVQSRAVIYRYDAAGRLLLADYGDGNALRYHYDPAGNLRGITTGYSIYLPVLIRQ